MGWFTPKYLNKDTRKAIDAIHKLTDQGALAEAALKHPSAEVREQAVKRLTDLPVLEKIMQSDPATRVRLAALKTDSRLKNPVYIGDELQEVEKIHPDDTILFSVALRDSSGEVRNCAMMKLQSHELVRRLAIASSDEELAKAACIHYLSIEHCFGYCSEPRNPDLGMIKTLFDETPFQSVRWAILDNLRDYPHLIGDIASSVSDFSIFKRIVEKADSAEEARVITRVRGQSLPVCGRCHRPAFRYYRFGNDHICCWKCVNFQSPDSYTHAHKDIIAGVDIPAGKYLVMAVGTCEEGEEVRQVRNGKIYKSVVLTSQYNEDGIPGQIDFEFLEGDGFEGARCGFQQKEILAEFIEINDWVKSPADAIGSTTD